ncbi:MAG: RNA-binding S4 domain-containing protein [Candidatus Obscuribacterales bacterium]|nr:RNA-binding S4 domain-containing protein [Candidatus Obscuribacterales bacterium]
MAIKRIPLPGDKEPWRPSQLPEVKGPIDYIRLDQFLKFAGLADSGGEAKAIIQNGDIAVNGEREGRRGRKLRAGDTVQFRDEKVVIDAVLPALEYSEA